MKSTHLVMCALIGALAASGEAAAVRLSRIKMQSAVNNCQVALPRAGDAFRKRPTGIANEGGSTAFINCSWSVETRSSTGISGISAFFSNRSAIDAVVSCTLVNGVPAPIGTPTFFPDAISVVAGSSFSTSWTATRNAGNKFTTPSLSCAIPQGVEFNLTSISYDADVGL